MPDYTLENSAESRGYKIICGVDEAGRGPLAGPVCAAAVILPRGLIIDRLDDSKKLSPSRREKLYIEITEKAEDYSIAFSSVEEIETLNILEATMLAMRRAVEGLKKTPDLALIDGNKTPSALPCEGVSAVRGDSISCSIAAASILAKVTRDRLMLEYDKDFPEYGFSRHKGYGTAEHIAAIKKFGVCPIHRQSFLKKIK